MIPQSLKESITAKTNRIFQTHRIPEIRQIESQTRIEIEEKRHDLKNLIGARYRDIIEASDAIVDMRSAVQCLVTQISGLKQLADNRVSIASPSQATDSVKSDLGQIISNTRVLYEAPEKVWSYLDSGDFISATKTYLLAQHANSRIQEYSTSQNQRLRELAVRAIETNCYESNCLTVAQARFKIAENAWQRLSKVPEKILASSRLMLQRQECSVHEFGSALVALIALGGKSPTQVFMEFLDKRKQTMDNIVVISKSRVASDDDAIERLFQLLKTLQYSVYEIGCLFVRYPLDMHALEEPEITHRRKSDKHFGRPLLFTLYDTLRESLLAETGATQLPPIQEIPEETCRNLVTEWIKSFGKSLATPIQTLLSVLNTCESLSRLEMKLAKQIQDPFAGIAASKHIGSDIDENFKLSWQTVTVVVLNSDLDLWELLFYSKFTERCFAVIRQAFEAINLSDCIDEAIQSLSAPRQNKPEEDLSSPVGWNSFDITQDVRARSVGLTPLMNDLLSEVDSRLTAAMKDFQHLLGEQLARMLRKEDTRSIRQHIQEMALSFVVAFSQQLLLKISNYRDRVESGRTSILSSQEKSISPQLRQDVEAALFLAQLARLVGTHSQQLRSLLHLDQPEHIVKISSKAQKLLDRLSVVPSTRELAGKTSLFAKCFSKLYEVCFDGYIVWARFVATITSFGFNNYLSALIEDGEAQKIRHTWLELKLPVKQTDPNQPQLSDTESQDKEITQDYVPHQPSTWLLRLLFALAKEVHRVSAHLIDRSVVEYLVAQVTSLLFNQLTGFIVAKQQQTIPKEALVQLWFDTKFLFELLAGRVISSPLFRERALISEGVDESQIPKEFDEVEEMLKWKKEVDSLISSIKAMLDPIDVAFYTPHVNKHTRLCQQRLNVLLGVLTMQKGDSSSTASSSTANESTFHPANIMACIPSAGRFPQLPIATPSPVVNKQTTVSSSTRPPPSNSPSNTTGRQASLWGKISEGATSWFG